VETGNELNDGTNLVFIDLARFDKTIDACDSLEDMWLYSIKNMSKQSFCPNTVEGTEVEELFRQAELAKMTEEQRISFEISVMSRNDMLNSFRETLEAAKEEVKAKGLAEGRAEGLAEGRAEGRAEGQLIGERTKAQEIARNMLEAGIEIAQICRFTGLDVEEIQVPAHSKL
jgi:predicted transposase/invertase (TIGR01784 family)